MTHMKDPVYALREIAEWSRPFTEETASAMQDHARAAIRYGDPKPEIIAELRNAIDDFERCNAIEAIKHIEKALMRANEIMTAENS